MKRGDVDHPSATAAEEASSAKRQCTSGLSLAVVMEQSADHKTKKYDRQLRLWGDHGQAALEKARVCLIGATATGTEILKNLVLPGLGSFCIVDSETVKMGDLGSNFFVTAQDIGGFRAEAATRLLLEMNSDVKGQYMTDTLESLVANRPSFFQHFTIVIAADVPSEKLLLDLGRILWPVGIPLVACRAYGLVGWIRIVCREHFVTESKPDNFIQDLRLDTPFPELVALKDSVDFGAMTKKAHSHVPFVIILLAFLEKWKTLRGSLPTTYQDKVKFREFVDEGRLKNDDGIPLAEENFEEACKAVVKTVGVSKVPDEIERLFRDPACDNLTIFSPKFWIVIRAIRDFTVGAEGAGHLPVSGALPDMFSDTESFVHLQNVYKAKADSDAAAVYAKVCQLNRDLGLSEDFISLSEVKYYSRNAAFLRCVRTTSLEEELGEGSSVAAGLTGFSVDDPDFRNSLWYVMLRAVSHFHNQTGVLPGLEHKTYEEDAVQLKVFAQKFMKAVGVVDGFRELAGDEVVARYAREVARFGGEQVHSVAAFVGGTVGQEVIKLITGQYVPLNNTLVYDATACTTSTFQF
ncbi:NEDD8-activating enzyme E1 regulatory subunit [Hypsibius exemplaris]|uniref:NEDD8-activating enzyme E1 regulatory subunit n=1 Tax=Hypsibius exemplaris TaxID=2072580 RepID=A0A9X6ND08_HYPEX|nr:NEDD8-activating enzyme E1 regulatory subunit [Hypsibius exemplaris]